LDSHARRETVNWVEVHNQQEADRATARGDGIIVRAGLIRVWGSSSVVAWGSSRVEAWESSHVVAAKYVAVHRPANSKAKVTGGVLIQLPAITTAEDWCDFYGVEPKDGIVILFKGLDDHYQSSREFVWTPGSVPVAPDWDGGMAECGGGLHFSPRPSATRQFAPEATRFVGCPVRLSDIRPPKEADKYPAKVKASGCCGPVFEVDLDGNPIGGAK